MTPTFQPKPYGLSIKVADTPENRRWLAEYRHRAARLRWKMQYRAERLLRKAFSSNPA